MCIRDRDKQKFSDYFNSCPVISVPGRNFPVDIKYDPVKSEDLWSLAAVEQCMKLHKTKPVGHILLFLTGQDEIDKAVEQLHRAAEQIDKKTLKEMACPDLMVLPCYGALPHNQQSYIFDDPPEGCRKVVVATNIAETSLTVPGIRYVVDPGYVKQKMYDEGAKMESLRVMPISRTAAKQRAGRAGRTMAGVCVRLYSAEWMHTEMAEETLPEIQRASLANTVLMLKGLGISDVLKFDYMDPPSSELLEKALVQLAYLGALGHSDGKITPLGEKMLELPVEPEMSRILLRAIELGCLDPVLTIVALLSAENVLYRPGREDLRQEANESHSRFHHFEGDHLTLLNVYESWDKNGRSPRWCRRRFVDSRAMNRARQIREQLESVMEQRWQPDRSAYRHNDSTSRILESLVAGLFPNSARLVPVSAGTACYRTLGSQQLLVHMHPSSAILSEKERPIWVVYSDLLLTSKAYMKQVSRVKQEWIRDLVDSMKHVNLAELTGKVTSNKRKEPEPEAPPEPVSYTHLRAHETPEHLVCRLLLEKKKKNI
eukprot:TRINITY_DN24342_c0_g1_i2.p1 TRINITY_DN24342_c0_g1~~TRINITY_DN24342_c0_g1_i2.p1  ORF type:complete len:543 (-),score=129.46 TRINITY_DN24342_c0_g1_i2:112-1740(-)